METKLDAISRYIRRTGMLFLALAFLAVMAAFLAPVSAGDAGDKDHAIERVPIPHSASRSSADLQGRIAGTVEELIRPLQGVAAIKDDGTAKKMAERLKLQGIVSMGGEYVAYISIDKGSAVSVKQGGTVLEFSVLNVEEKSVVLSREGVQVVLP